MEEQGARNILFSLTTFQTPQIASIWLQDFKSLGQLLALTFQTKEGGELYKTWVDQIQRSSSCTSSQPDDEWRIGQGQQDYSLVGQISKEEKIWALGCQQGEGFLEEQSFLLAQSEESMEKEATPIRL